MTTFQPQQSNRGRLVSHNAHATALQIHAMNCTIKLHGNFHEARKIVRNNLQRAVQTYAAECQFYTSQAEPLSWLRFLRLAQISPKVARSPARRARDVRETSGKTTGEISRHKSEPRLGGGPALATAMPPSVRPDDSQDNLRCAGNGRAMSALETRETTRNTVTQQLWSNPRNSQSNISQDDSSKSHRQFQP